MDGWIDGGSDGLIDWNGMGLWSLVTRRIYSFWNYKFFLHSQSMELLVIYHFPLVFLSKEILRLFINDDKVDQTHTAYKAILTDRAMDEPQIFL